MVFAREVRARAAADEQVQALRSGRAKENGRACYERALADATLEKQAELAEEFDAVHTVERALEVGSLEAIVEPSRMRPYLIDLLREELEGER